MDYELYHDESKESGYWHGILLVPIIKKDALLGLLQKAREKTGYSGFKTFKELRGTGTHYECKRVWSQIALFAMQTQKINDYPIDWGKNSNPLRFDFINDKIGIKFILFREVDNFMKMYHPLDIAQNVETTFRFGLKGGVHLFGSNDNPINIVKIHFDGYEHNLRHLSYEGIIGKLNGLRPYVSTSRDVDIIDDRSGKRDNPNRQNDVDCELLLFTDLLVSSFRTAIISSASNVKKDLSYFPRILLERYYKGFARMQNSRWFNSFCISECSLDSEGWSFRTIEIVKEDLITQLPLSF